MIFRWSKLEVEATRWFKNGDHPLDYVASKTGLEQGEPFEFSPEHRKEKDWEGDVVRRYRRPRRDGERICPFCACTMDAHGWLDFPPDGQVVCPGDWIVTLPDSKLIAHMVGGFRAVSNVAFMALAIAKDA